MRPQGIETNNYSSVNKAVIFNSVLFTALNGSVPVSMVHSSERVSCIKEQNSPSSKSGTVYADGKKTAAVCLLLQGECNL